MELNKIHENGGEAGGCAANGGEMYLADRQVNRSDRHVVVAPVTDVWLPYGRSVGHSLKVRLVFLSLRIPTEEYAEMQANSRVGNSGLNPFEENKERASLP